MTLVEPGAWFGARGRRQAPRVLSIRQSYGGAYADVHTVSELDRPRNPCGQGCPEASQAAQELAKKVGVEIKEVYLTSGDDDLLLILDTPSGDNVAKFALALGSQGNVRTRTARAWPQSEFQKLISELP